MTSREYMRLSPEHRKVLDKHLATYPIKLGSLARELGIDSIKITNMRPGVSGQITTENGGYVIRINRNEARERQRFTLAHELAHFLLHRKIIDQSPDGITDNVLYRSGAPEVIEHEANRLAADLVMPMPLVRRRLETAFQGIITDATIESLAASFEVSKAAMEIRLSAFAET